MYRTHRLLLAIVSAGALLLSAPAGAGQASTSFGVTATVGQACTLSASDLAFGPYTGTAVSSQIQIMIDCGGAVVPFGSVALISATGGGTDGFRMSTSTEFLDYNLYRDAAHGISIISALPFTKPAGVIGFDIFGEIPAGQAVPDGSYSDT